MGQLHIGTFDSEQFWRNPMLAALPSLPDLDRNHIVMAMDELLFAFCQPEDTLITRFQMNEEHKQYLSEIGFRIHNNPGLWQAKLFESTENQCIFQLLSQTDKADQTASLVCGLTLAPYSVLPYAEEMCHRFALPYELPPSEMVIRVNSKSYSNHLREELEMFGKGQVVYHCEELLTLGTRWLNEYTSILIKDPFGVSGKGNMHVTSLSILQRICAYIAKQEKQGKQVEFIVEPYWDKSEDFSCQLDILRDGTFQITSIQQMINSQQAYLGSQAAEQAFVDILESKNYFEEVNKTARQLFKEGYHGHVCIDSMMLTDGNIVPVVEINARKSMGTINEALNKFLDVYQLKSTLTFISVGFQHELSFADILHKLDSNGLLYKPGHAFGVIPLSSNTVFIGREIYNQRTLEHARVAKTFKGRLYVSIVTSDYEQRHELLEKLKHSLLELSLTIYN